MMSFALPDSSRSAKAGYKLLWLLFQPYKWLIYVPFLGLSTLILSSPVIITSILFSPRLAGKLFAVAWARLNALVAMMPVSVSGREHIDSRQSYIIVANHQSLFDIFVVYGWLGIDFRWVMKRELRKVPILGYCCEKLEHVYIDRSNQRAAIATLNAAKENIVNGTSILFFPEGRRSKTGQLLPFKKGAFRMALDLQLPILPITIAGTKAVLPSSTMDLMPGKARLIIHEPISTDRYDMPNVQELMSLTREQISSALE